jgi:hypothetical protein
MSWNSHLVPTRFLFVLLFCAVTIHVAAAPRPLPAAVIRAHTIFLWNETGFNELDYSTILEISKWGRFDLTGSPEKAELILRLDNGKHVHAVAEGGFPSSNAFTGGEDFEIPRDHTRISLLDRKTNTVLWSGTHKTEGGKVKNGHLLDGLREAYDAHEKNHR